MLNFVDVHQFYVMSAVTFLPDIEDPMTVFII